MKKLLLPIIAAGALVLAANASAQDAKAPNAENKSKPPQEELEAKFISTMTKATMAGRWCSIKDGQLGPNKEDKYTIASVSKIADDSWIINARIQYGERNIVAPIPVQVKWAGDTAVIIVDKIPMPGGGTYTARVLIYEKTYAGTWSGGDHGGLLNGIITNEDK